MIAKYSPCTQIISYNLQASVPFTSLVRTYFLPQGTRKTYMHKGSFTGGYRKEMPPFISKEISKMTLPQMCWSQSFPSHVRVYATEYSKCVNKPVWEKERERLKHTTAATAELEAPISPNFQKISRIREGSYPSKYQNKEVLICSNFGLLC